MSSVPLGLGRTVQHQFSRIRNTFKGSQYSDLTLNTILTDVLNAPIESQGAVLINKLEIQTENQSRTQQARLKYTLPLLKQVLLKQIKIDTPTYGPDRTCKTETAKALFKAFVSTKFEDKGLSLNNQTLNDAFTTFIASNISDSRFKNSINEIIVAINMDIKEEKIR